MFSAYAEKTLAKILGYGAALTTIFLVSSSVTDPVNAPKLVVLGLIAFGAAGVLIANRGAILKDLSLPSAVSLLLFIIAATSSVVFSNSPLSQNIWGVYGRNNGLVTYIFLVSIFLSASVLANTASFELISRALLFAGLINVIYCGWVILFGDFIGWSNPYGNILGTFGNPNFIGAFLGIFVSAYTAYAIGPRKSNVWKWSLLIVVPLTLFEIVDSSAIQGRVVAAGGLALVVFSYLKFRVNKLFLALYSGLVSLFGMFAVLGALQIGPLTQYIYKTSVSLRGQYWLAGWNAGQGNPFTGLGMDALGDWYRRVRDPQALILPGVNTVVNAAHNVFMDMFAFGGWPLLITYLVITSCSAYALIRTFIRLDKYDGTFVAIAVAWIGYQVQSIISINQIGLAVWGWLLGGILIAYERNTRTYVSKDHTDEPVSKGKINRKKSHTSDPKVVLTAAICALVGLVIALPPMASDSKWKKSLNGQSVQAIEESMKASFFNPQNVNKYVTNIQLLEKNSFQDLAHKYALEAVKWNPQSYDSWRFVYFIAKSTPAERELALSKMKELDPLNPDVTSPR